MMKMAHCELFQVLRIWNRHMSCPSLADWRLMSQVVGSFTHVTAQCLKSKKVSGSKSSNHSVLFEPYDLCFVVTEGFENLHVVLTEFRGNPDPGWSLRKVPR